MPFLETYSTIDSVPPAELESFWNWAAAHPEYLNPDHVRRRYRRAGLRVIADPFGSKVVRPIVRALRRKTPFSAIRIGDGEAGILSYGAYRGTPNLDRHALTATTTIFDDSFRLTETWALILRDLMMASVQSADLIGCRGMSRRVQYFSGINDLKSRVGRDIRGAVGIYRAVDYPLRLARDGILRGKIIGSAHLYFSVVNNLSRLFRFAKNILCISPEPSVIDKMRTAYPGNRFHHIPVGRKCPDFSQRPEPSYINEVETMLPSDLHGWLCLVGAGIWAEIYCTWIKRRGGAAVDIGSGFDLLAGRIARPAHREVLGAEVPDYL